MSAPGWYPDPGGQPGMFRYWDGQAWSAALSPNPQAAPPGSSMGPLGAADEVRPAVAGEPSRSGGKGGLLAAAAIVVVLVVVVGFIVRGVAGGLGNGREGTETGVGGPRPVCPEFDTQPATETATRDGRVYGGKLSYPQLGAPWSEPSREVRVPYGRNAWTQSILVEEYTATSSWVASVMVAELNAGDGFFTPQEGSEIVVTCIVGSFYGDAKVDRDDIVNQAMTVDGHDAWLVETNLSFKIPNLQTEGEWLAVLIVETGEGTASLYSASIPNTSPQWEAPARNAMADLRVDD
ncbi:MAG: DUF2510 domain-containing protein [Propionibacteriaceae bacterium]|nr:DUF2510 domain-containing protein [Propionibacteriaceae bacterium]